LRVWIQAWDTEGNMASWGSEAMPRTVGVASNVEATAPLVGVAAAEPAIVEQWWFWTIIGVVVVGTGVALGVALAPSGAATGHISVEMAPAAP
jgi:hypothetical protein